MYILPINKIDQEDKMLVGEKALRLALIFNANLPVPKGFVVTSEAYENFLNSNNLMQAINNQLQLLNYSNPENINHISNLIQNLIDNTPVQKPLAKEIIEAYENLEGTFKQTPVAIRSSLINLNIPSGQNSLFLNISGETSVIELVKKSWTYLFAPINLINQINPLKSKMAVIVQEMVNAENSGFVHTLDIRDQNKKILSIEAIYGIGEFLNQHYVKPDYYFVDKKSIDIKDKIINRQTIELSDYYHKTLEKNISSDKQRLAKLNEEEIKTLSQMCLKIDRLNLKPQTIEWALVKNKFYFLQTQELNPDLISLNKKVEPKKIEKENINLINLDKLNLPLLAHGIGVSQGFFSGKALLVKHPDDEKFIDEQNIIYTQNFTADLLPLVYKAKAILSQNDSYTSPAALIAREIGIPAIFGIKNILEKINSEKLITVNAGNGNIYFGKPDLSSKVIGFSRERQKPLSQNDIKLPYLKTATLVFANLSSGHNPTIYKDLNIDGIAYVKGEYILYDLGVHPKKFIQENKEIQIINLIISHLKKVCKGFCDKTVFYSFSDLQSNLLRQLIFGKYYEEKETNPQLGLRGSFRHLIDQRLLKLEIEAIQKVRQKYSNLQLVLPFSRSVLEFKQFFNLIQSLGLKPSSTLNFYNLAFTASNLILSPQYFQSDTDGLIIDLDQVSAFCLGIDGTNPNLAFEYNQADPSIIWLLNHVINYAHKNNKKIIAVGDILAKNSDMLHSLIKSGIYGISVSPDLIHAARRFAAQTEEKIIKK